MPDSAEPSHGPSEPQLTPEEEARERRIWAFLGLGGAVVLALFLALFWPVMAARLNAAKQLDTATALVKQAEARLPEVDSAISALPTSDSNKAGGALAAARSARAEFREATALLNDANPHLTEDEQRRAALVLKVASARETQVARATPLLVAAAAPGGFSKSSTLTSAAAATAVGGYLSARGAAVRADEALKAF